MPFRESIRKVHRCFLVFSALGLHTQDRISGGYSLLSPRALYIRKGKKAGPVSISMHGNFFANLNDESMRFVAFRGYRCPGLMVKASVAVTKGG